MFGEHAAFIVPAYLITAFALIATTLVIYLNYRKCRAELTKLEAETKQ